MEHYIRIQHAVDYIEERLQEPLSIADIASAAGFSVYHFHRLFHAVSGFTVQEYMRRRRLTEAAAMLQETEQSVLHIAVAFQYGSQEAFTRAFAACFGITPAKYRQQDLQVVDPQPKMDLASFTPNIQGGLHMVKPEILQLGAIKLMGRNYETSLTRETYFEDIPGFYRDFGARETFMQIPGRARPGFAYGVGHSYREDGGFRFLIGEEVEAFPEAAAEAGIDLDCLELPAGNYAAFKVDSAPELGQNTWKYIYGTWLPNSNYKRADGPDFEVTDVMHSNPGRIRMTIYIPIR